MKNAHGPPRKGARAVSPAQGHLRLTDCATNSVASAGAQVCRHRFVRVELMPPGYIHHAKETCDDCGAFVGWAPKLENLERRAGNSFRIAKLSMVDGLNSWEPEFLASISKQRWLSPKQQMVLDRLVAKYLDRPLEVGGSDDSR
jgi:hypothetical protein